MTRAPLTSASTTFQVLKVLYLLAVTAIAFMVPAFSTTRPARWLIIPALLALQVVILLACRIPIAEILRPAWRLKWLFLFLIGCYVLLPAESPGDVILPWRIPVLDWVLPLNLTGFERAALMCLQILTLLLASTVVRLTGSGRDLVDGLRALRLPDLFVYSLDHTLGLLGGAKKSRRGHRGDKEITEWPLRRRGPRRHFFEGEAAAERRHRRICRDNKDKHRARRRASRP